VVTNFPGEVDVPARDRPACRVLMHCEALTDQPRVVAHDIVLKLKAHISANVLHRPHCRTNAHHSLLATLYALQYQPGLTYKRIREAIAHLVLLNVTMPSTLCKRCLTLPCQRGPFRSTSMGTTL
jgi:hypothetical protein